MTKEEVFDKAWKLGLKGDFSLVDEIYHPKYRAIQKNINVEVDLDADKIVISTVSDFMTFGPFRVIFSNNEFSCLERHMRSMLTGEPNYNTVITALIYKDGKIISQESVAERDQLDPSEGQDWNWEDYE
jgi:hypothetical protein|tara:strand:- start:220 stop:606 length:387 start_codon:yes stop_codon:yes gene_type:complete